ncbi:MAG: DUF4349 domain-containing protein [Proteocatella sp.]
MKKYISLGMVGLILLIFILSGCGLKSENYDTGTSESKTSEQAEMLPEENVEGVMAADEANSVGGVNDNIVLENRKLVYRVQMVIQTIGFEDSISKINTKVSELGGYIQSSQVSGNDYGYSGGKSGSIVARIPSEKLNQFLNASKSFGNISSQSQSIEDITMRYTDVEARQKSLQVEFDRLLELVKKADKLEDVIRLEERLSQIRYELDSLKSQIKGMDNDVSYSTINMDIYEVALLESSDESKISDRIKSAFSKSLYNLENDIKNIIVGLFAAIPYIVVIGIIISMFLGITRKLKDKLSYKINNISSGKDKLKDKENDEIKDKKE